MIITLREMPALRWYKKKEFDVPELNSPQPCAHGGGCDYKRKSPESGEMVEGCCAFVHPGEEGTGRHLFDGREVERDGVMVQQPACVRLTGGAGYYERRRLRLSWKAWCERQGIPFGRDEDEEVEVRPRREAGGGGGGGGGPVSREMQDAIDRAVAKALAGRGPAPQRRPAYSQERPKCDNCEKPGHAKATCWAPGGDAHKPRDTFPEEDQEAGGAVEETDTPASPTPTHAKAKAPRAPRKPRAAAEESKDAE